VINISNNPSYSKELISLLNNILEPIEQFSGVVDIQNKYPEELLSKLKANKLFYSFVPKDLEGMGLNLLSFNLLLYEIGKRLPSLALSLFTHTQVLEYLKMISPNMYTKVIKNNDILALAITEPGAGTDIKKMETKIISKNGKRVIKGIKSMVTNGAYADRFLIICKTGENEFASCLLHKNNGVEIETILDLLGMRGSGISRITLREIEIKDEQILDRGKKVLNDLFYILALGRIFTSSTALGITYAALEELLKWGTRREVLGKKLIEFDNLKQNVGEFIADAELCGEFLNLISRNLERLNKSDLSYYSSIIKYKTTSLAKKIVDLAMTIYASHGYLKGTRIERLYRDVKAFEFIEGSNEALRSYVFKVVLKRFSNNANYLLSIGGSAWKI